MSKTKIDAALLHLAVPIDSVQSHPRNPKQGDVDEIAGSLARFGQVRPILVQASTNYVVAGNHTRKAAVSLGFTEIAAVVVEMTDEEALAYLLADNRLADKGDYDDAALVEILKELSLAGRLEGTGYSEADVEEMMDMMDGMPTVHPSEMAKTDTLTEHPRNPKTHDDAQLKHLGRSLAEHGFYRQVVIAEDGTILAGHGLVQAAREAGLPRIPVVRLPYSPDSPEALKVLAGDNAIGDLAALDRRKLTDMLKEVKDSGDPSALLGSGFDPATLANLVYVSRPESEIQDSNAAAEWVGMPDFEAAGPRVQLMLAFDTEAERDQLVGLLNLTIAKKNRMTWSAWWPVRDREDLSSLRVERSDRAERVAAARQPLPEEELDAAREVEPVAKPKPRAKRKPKAKPAAETVVPETTSVPQPMAEASERVQEEGQRLIDSGAVLTPEQVHANEAAREEVAAPETAATAATAPVMRYLCTRCGAQRDPLEGKDPICDGPADQEPHPEQTMILMPVEASDLEPAPAARELVEYICPVCEYVTEVDPAEGRKVVCKGSVALDGEHIEAEMLQVVVHRDQVPQ